MLGGYLSSSPSTDNEKGGGWGVTRPLPLPPSSLAFPLSSSYRPYENHDFCSFFIIISSITTMGYHPL